MGLTHDANALKLATSALNFPTSLRRNNIELIDDRKNWIKVFQINRRSHYHMPRKNIKDSFGSLKCKQLFKFTLCRNVGNKDESNGAEGAKKPIACCPIFYPAQWERKKT